MALVDFDEDDGSDPQRRRRLTLPGQQTQADAGSFAPLDQPTEIAPLPGLPRNDGNPDGNRGTDAPTSQPRPVPIPNPNPVPFPENDAVIPRWSTELERIPGYLEGADPGTQSWFKSEFYDRDGGSQALQQRLGQLRQEAGQKGVRVAEDDASVFLSDLFRHYAPGSIQAPAPQPQPAASTQPWYGPSSPWGSAPPRDLGVDGQSNRWNVGGGSPDVPAQFTDPITKWVEQFAQERAKERENPSVGSGQALLEQALRSVAGDLQAPQANSGQALLEQALRGDANELGAPSAGSGQALYENRLRDVSSQFQSGGYTPAEQEIFQTQAIEPIEKLRAARKQQVLHSLASRGIDPNSGVGRQMIADVDRQMDSARIETQRTLAGDEARERSKRMLQAVELLSTLSGEEGGRRDRRTQKFGQLANLEQGRRGGSIELLSGLADQENRRKNEAFDYRKVPLNLADRSFNQARQTYDSGGNPLTLASPLLQLSQLQQGRSNNWQEALGYLAALLANS